MFLPKPILTAAVLLSVATTAAADEKINFEDHVKPIFRAKCASCHNTNKKTADLDLSNYTALMQGGGSGPSIEPGDPEGSYLYLLITHDSEPYMPPNSDRIPDEMINTVRTWIEQGAPENSSSKVMIPKKAAVDLSVDVSGDRPSGPPPMPDVMGLEPVVYTNTATAVSAIATSPWAKLIAVAGQKQVLLYNSETLQPLGVLPFPEGQARVLKFSRSGGLLLAGGGHGAARGLAVVWDIRTGERIMELGDELDEVLAADISADQSLVALGGPGKIVRVYSTVSGEQVYEITKHTDWVYSLEFSPDSVLLATADRAGGLHVWEAFTGRQYLTLNGHKGAVNAVSWRLDSNVLASASEDASVKLWEMEEGKNIKSWNAHGGGTLALEFCRDGRVATSGRDNTSKLWDQNGKQLRAFEKFNDLALRVSFCDETNRMIAGDWTGEIRVWKGDDGARLGTLSTNPPTLQTRLQQATAQVAPLEQKLTAAKAAHDAAVAAHAAHQKKIADALAAGMALQKKHDERKAGLEALKKKVAEAVAKQATNKARLDTLAKAVPELDKATKTATQAAGMMASDPQLKAVVEKLAAQLKARQTELQQAQQTAQAIAAEIGKSNEQINAEGKLIPADLKAIAAAKAGMAGLSKALQPLAEKMAAAATAHNAAQASLTAVKSQIQQWNEYIALTSELKLLKETRAEHDKALIASLEADAEVKGVMDTINSTQQLVQTRQTEIAAANQKLTELQTGVDAATKQKADVAALVAGYEKAIPVLQTAAGNAKAASDLLPADEQLKQTVAAVQATADEKVKLLAAKKQEVQTIDQKIATAMVAMTETKTAMQAAQKDMETAGKTVQELTVSVKPMQQTAEAAKAVLTKAKAEVARVEAIVEARKTKLRPKVQVTRASR
ncbi:MAG: hypothetical protein NXI04_14525 [Planctomycetaceae bacterium]|nr:hypothetical protein [Planctomycetaceae bacterium]